MVVVVVVVVVVAVVVVVVVVAAVVVVVVVWCGVRGNVVLTGPAAVHAASTSARDIVHFDSTIQPVSHQGGI